MKKKIVYWLCEHRCWWLAKRISPSLAWWYRLELLADKFNRGFAEGVKQSVKLNMSKPLSPLAEEILADMDKAFYNNEDM